MSIQSKFGGHFAAPLWYDPQKQSIFEFGIVKSSLSTKFQLSKMTFHIIMIQNRALTENSMKLQSSFTRCKMWPHQICCIICDFFVFLCELNLFKKIFIFHYIFQNSKWKTITTFICAFLFIWNCIVSKIGLATFVSKSELGKCNRSCYWKHN